MKKCVSILILAALIAALCPSVDAKKKDAQVNSVVELAKQYENREGVTVFSLGSFGMGIMKSVIKMSADKEDKAALEVLNGIKKLVVVDCEDAESKVRDEFNAKVSELLAGTEKIVETKDEGEVAYVYGTPSKSGDSLSDITIHVPAQGSLICILGTIGANDISKLMEMKDE